MQPEAQGLDNMWRQVNREHNTMCTSIGIADEYTIIYRKTIFVYSR